MAKILAVATHATDDPTKSSKAGLFYDLFTCRPIHSQENLHRLGVKMRSGE